MPPPTRRLHSIVSSILRGTFRRLSPLGGLNAHSLNLENCFFDLSSIISQFLDLIHWMVFDFIFYCMTLNAHTLQPPRREWPLKGPLKYLLMPLLGKNQLAITLHMYASIGPNLDNTHTGQYSPVHDVIAPRPMSRDQKQKNAFYLNGLNIFPVLSVQ